MYGIFTYIWVIYDHLWGKCWDSYSSTMDPRGNLHSPNGPMGSPPEEVRCLLRSGFPHLPPDSPGAIWNLKTPWINTACSMDVPWMSHGCPMVTVSNGHYKYIYIYIIIYILYYNKELTLRFQSLTISHLLAHMIVEYCRQTLASSHSVRPMRPCVLHPRIPLASHVSLTSLLFTVP